MKSENGEELYTVNEVAQKLSVSRQTVYSWMSAELIVPSYKCGKAYLFTDSDIANRKPMLTKIEAAYDRHKRDQEFIDLYQSGATLSEIGNKYGITRERVRQRLSFHGINRVNGGMHVRALSNSVLRQKADEQRLNLRATKIYGCDFKTVQQVRASFGNGAQKLDAVYTSCRKKAQRERIPWSISLPEFAEVAREHLTLYGKGKGRFVLRLIDPDKPYTKDNVMMMEHGESSQLARIANLAPRQKQIMDLVSSGLGPSEIAKELGLAVGTVACHINNAKKRNKFSALQCS